MNDTHPPSPTPWKKQFNLSIAIALFSVVITAINFIYGIVQDHKAAQDAKLNTRFDVVLTSNEELRMVQVSGDYGLPITDVLVTPIFQDKHTLSFVKGLPIRPELVPIEATSQSRIFSVANFSEILCLNQRVQSCSLNDVAILEGQYSIDGNLHDFQVAGL